MADNKENALQALGSGIGVRCAGSQDHRPFIQHMDPFFGTGTQSSSLNSQRVICIIETGGSAEQTGDWCTQSDVHYVAMLNQESISMRTPVPVPLPAVREEDVQLFVPNPQSGHWFRPRSLTFTVMIKMAMDATPDLSIPVTHIYKFVTECFPYFRTTRTKWQNSVRHNLSHSGYYIKTGTPHTEKKGWNWTVRRETLSRLMDEMAAKQITDLKQLQHQLSCPAVLIRMRDSGLLHPDIRV